MPSLHTTQMQLWIQRFQRGDQNAADELLGTVRLRFTKLGQKMFSGFAAIHRWVELDDVLQNASLRMLRTLREVNPDSVQGFFRLAATSIRRELLDTARSLFGPLGLGSKHESRNFAGSDDSHRFEPADPASAAGELDRWCGLHEAVEKLPEEQRQVVDAVYYHGWTQKETAAHLGVAEKTINRRWRDAKVALAEFLGR